MVYVVRVEEPIDGPGEASFAFPDLKLLHSLVWACGEMRSDLTWFVEESDIPDSYLTFQPFQAESRRSIGTISTEGLLTYLEAAVTYAHEALIAVPTRNASSIRTNSVLEARNAFYISNYRPWEVVFNNRRLAKEFTDRFGLLAASERDFFG